MIESIEKLRSAESFSELAISIIGDDNSFRSVQEFWCALAEEIEAEIAERYIELPVDADGVPIQIGDLVTHPFFEGSREVRSLTKEQGSPYWHLGVDGGKVTAHTCRHAKPRNVEDVLVEFTKVVTKLDIEHSLYSDVLEPVVKKYADELREMIGRSDG